MTTTATKAKPKKSTKKALVTTKEQDTALAEFFDFGEDINEGFDEDPNQDLLIPYLRVIQTNSKAVKSPEKGGSNCTAGQILNTVTQEARASLVCVPAMYKRVFVEWKPNNEGWVANHSPTDPRILEMIKTQPFGKLIDPDSKNEIVETVYLYVVPINPDTGLPESSFGVLDFTSMKLKVWKRWISSILMFTYKDASGRKVKPPLFCHRIEVTTSEESNSKGDFFNTVLGPMKGSIQESMQGPSTEAFQVAKELKEMVQSGIASIDLTSAAASAEVSSDEDPDDKGAF